MSDEIRRLDLAPSVHGVVNHLTAEIDNIQELYVVVRHRDGTFYECMSGNVAGLAFAVLVMQNYALKSLRGELGPG